MQKSASLHTSEHGYHSVIMNILICSVVMFERGGNEVLCVWVLFSEGMSGNLFTRTI